MMMFCIVRHYNLLHYLLYDVDQRSLLLSLQLLSCNLCCLNKTKILEPPSGSVLMFCMHNVHHVHYLIVCVSLLTFANLH